MNDSNRSFKQKLLSRMRKALCFALVLCTIGCLFSFVDQAEAATRGIVVQPDQMQITVKVTYKEKLTQTYDGTEHKWNATVKAESNDDRFKPEKFRYSGSTIVRGTNAGYYGLYNVVQYCTYNNDNKNVTFTVVSPTLTIEKKKMTITVDGSTCPKAKKYSGDRQFYTGTVSARSDDRLFDASKFSYSSDEKDLTVSAKNANTKQNQYHETKIDINKCKYNDKNIEPKFVAGNPIRMKINPKPVTITVNGGLTEKKYTGKEIEINGPVTIQCKVITDLDKTDLISAPFTYTGTLAGTRIGLYEATFSEKNCYYDDPNYTVTFKTGSPLRLNIIPVEGRPFQDVTKKKYYYEAVRWAKEQHIVFAIDENGNYEKNGYYFRPDGGIKRKDVIEFIWRAMGCPGVYDKPNPYSDVVTDPGSTSYKAALWAYYYNNPKVLVNTNTSSNGKVIYGGDNTCTRGQAITLLWKAMGCPEPELYNQDQIQKPFTDVDYTSECGQAVVWAYNHEPNRIVGGTSGTTFSPDTVASRAQFVMFLYNMSFGPEWWDGHLNPFDSGYLDAEPGIIEWPSLSRSSYCDFTTQYDITLYPSTYCSGPKKGTIPKATECRADIITDDYIHVEYTLAGKEYSGFIKRKDLIAASTPYKYQYNGKPIMAYRCKNGGGSLGNILAGSTVYGLPNNGDGNYIQVIFTDLSGAKEGRGYLLAWVLKEDYERIKFPELDFDDNGDGIYIDSVEDLLGTTLTSDNSDLLIAKLCEEYADKSPLPEFPLLDVQKVKANGSYYYKIDLENCPTVFINTSLFWQPNKGCYPEYVRDKATLDDGDIDAQWYFCSAGKTASSEIIDGDTYCTEEWWTYFVRVDNSYEIEKDKLIMKSKLGEKYKLITTHKYKYNGDDWGGDDWERERKRCNTDSDKIVSFSKDTSIDGAYVIPAFEASVLVIGENNGVSYYVDNYPNRLGFDEEHPENAPYFNPKTWEIHRYLKYYQISTNEPNLVYKKEKVKDDFSHTLVFAVGSALTDGTALALAIFQKDVVGAVLNAKELLGDIYSIYKELSDERSNQQTVSTTPSTNEATFYGECTLSKQSADQGNMDPKKNYWVYTFPVCSNVELRTIKNGNIDVYVKAEFKIHGKNKNDGTEDNSSISQKVAFGFLKGDISIGWKDAQSNNSVEEPRERPFSVSMTE